MVIVPTSITALVYPAQSPSTIDPRCPPASEEYRFLNMVNVDVDIPSSSSSSSDRFYYPQVSLQPDINSEKYWAPKAEAWKDRAVIVVVGGGAKKFHILLTMSQSGHLQENRHVSGGGGKVRGAIFVLRLSDTMDEGGRRYYVDIEPGEWEGEKVAWEDVAEEVVEVRKARGQ